MRPGVYIEEISLLPPSVVGVSTAIPAFIGKTIRQPDGSYVPRKISNMLEYDALYGAASEKELTVTKAVDGSYSVPEPAYLLPYLLQMFFKNGGGECFIVPLGDGADKYTKALSALGKEDEPTLIVMSEAVGETNYITICQEALTQCSTLGDRFAIFDIRKDDTTASTFRGISAEPKKLGYGAAYTPFLKTSLSYQYDETNVKIAGIEGKDFLSELKGDPATTKTYFEIKDFLSKQYLTLPPASAVAGVYARVDRERGVWKAPANVPLYGIFGPDVKISDAEHDALNIDATSGKSINAIRNYTGKGTLVMGARTLAGNDNEWRYINVRRLFNMIEESTKKATEAFLFESNTAPTWLKVKGMIESFLFGLWQKGALAGAVPEDAYFVNIGLGRTMTQDDILNGYMKVEIGIAAVRPAEFIILKFSHKMQVS